MPLRYVNRVQFELFQFLIANLKRVTTSTLLTLFSEYLNFRITVGAKAALL